MTHNIHGQQTFIFFAQEVFQTGNLTRSPRKQNLTTLFEERFRFMKGIPYTTLYILGTPKISQAFLRISPRMNRIPILVKSDTEHHSSLSDHRTGQQAENTSGRTFQQDAFIPIPGGINLQRKSLLPLMNDGTNLHTQVAPDTYFLIHNGIQKTFLVRMHCNTVPGTNRHTGMASATILLIVNDNHSFK
jgi:hypothetical protein